MGLYDYIKCEYPLPDCPLEGAADFPFQTKNTDEQYLKHYVISADGNLLLHGEMQDFTGGIEFYHSNVVASGPGTYTRDGEDSFWLEYVALFLHGKLTHIERRHFSSEPAQKSSTVPFRTRQEFSSEEERTAWWAAERKKFEEWKQSEISKRASPEAAL